MALHPIEQRLPQAHGPPLAGLRMTPAERLRWLEETMETLRRWQGRARGAPRGRRHGRSQEEP